MDARNSTAILVADDDQPNVKVVSFVLEDAGYRVLHACTGPSVLQVVRQDHPNLVLLGIQEPKISALKLCRRLRHASTIPIIFLATRAQLRECLLGLEIGANDLGLTQLAAPAV